MNRDVVIVICSRVQSQRLPGKALREVAGIPALKHILNRIKPLGLQIIIAVPTKEERIYKFHLGRRISKTTKIFSGFDNSPLHRMAAAVKKLATKANYVVRITHDDILIDAETVKAAIQKAIDYDAGYVVSPRIIEGAGVEVISVENLKHAAARAIGPIEHISYFVTGEDVPKQRRTEVLPRESICRPYRLTMDYPSDAVVLETVLRSLGPNASNDAICKFLDDHSHLLEYNKLPKISFYTCARNAVRFIGDCIRSIMDCGLPRRDYEYIIVEDGSTDATLMEIMNFAPVVRDLQIKVIVNPKNLGLASSSNIAISAARGEFVMRIDADDTVKFGAAHEMMKFAEDRGLSVVYPGYYEMTDNGRPYEVFVSGSIHHHAGGALMRKRLLNEIRFRDGLRHWDSLELYERLKDRGVGYYPGVGFYYRQHDGNMSRPSREREKVFKELRR